MKNKRFIAIIAILITLIYIMISYYSLKNINKEDIDVSKFISVVDEVSENKAQINWKYVAAIIGVIEKNDLKYIQSKEIEEVSKLFLSVENKSNSLNSIDEVFSKLKFTKLEKKRAHSYINQLKNFGETPQRLNKNSKYVEFIDSIKDDAIKNYKEYKVLPSITIAQAILESGWGESRLAKDYNNLFGIKADTHWQGEYVTLETREFQSDTINGRFRKYKDAGQSINDHAKFLSENKRYQNNGVFRANTYTYQAKALQNAGYSTDTNAKGEKIYANSLIEIIKQYNLQLIDSEVQSK
ncbi:glycoside hydrolase family 73 protein [Paraclostridium ghonii]|uniref:glycoside hydrolase family 73 protein n=1 Tax=Paraclostridium ghonii TaxID=29358 RepID=UPI00202CA919|nr:glycoside hydrolase family 73 protein [Paeniclostridium ghonii]